MNKKIIFLFLSTLSIQSFAQGIIYKCTDSEGNIAYMNESKSNSNCEKTNLAKVDKSTIINKATPINTNNPATINIGVGDNVVSEEQKIRDQKRAVILQNELAQEKSQLKTVVDMLSKLKSTDDENQISQLKNMVDAHKRNIASLEKELGVKGDIDLTPKVATKQNGLPFALPKEIDVSDVQIVQVKPHVEKPVVAAKQAPTPVKQVAQVNQSITPVVLVEKKQEEVQYVPENSLISNKSLKKKLEPVLIK